MRVLIADDHEPVRRGLRALLSVLENFDVCGEAADGKEAIAKTHELAPDVIVMDFSMPVLDGIEATREIRRSHPKTQIIMLSQYEAPEIIKEALTAGVDTYVTKTAIWPKLVPALRRVQMGERYFEADAEDSLEANIKESLERSSSFEQSVRDTEERFRVTFEQSAVGMAHVDPNGRWIRVNQRFCDLIGYTKTEIENVTTYDVTYPDDLAPGFAQERRLTSGELNHYSLEKRFVRKDGHLEPVYLTVDAVRDPQGQLKYCVHVIEPLSASCEVPEIEKPSPTGAHDPASGVSGQISPKS